MKKRFLIALALFMSVGAADVSAQSFLKKIKKAVETEVEKEVKNQVNKGIDKLTGKKQQPQNQQQEQTQSDTQVHQNTSSNRSDMVKIKPTVVTDKPDYGVVTGKVNGHEWVDLGLPSGTRWATCNVGATTPSQAGGLYAWGETATKTTYMPENGKTYGKDIDDISGNATYDVATAKWGKGWRMPTKAEFDELLEYCDYKYEKLDGRWGHRFTHRRSGRSIFLPSTGHKERGSKHIYPDVCGNYWSSTPYKNEQMSGAHDYHFGAALGEMGQGERSSGFGVRPVIDNDAMITIPSQGETNGHAWVDLGLPSGTKWATCNIDAPTSEEFGETYAWAEVTPVSDKTSPKNEVRGKEMAGIAGSTRYDAATALWGKGWRIPSRRNFEELMENCTWEYTSLGRIMGCKATSKINGNYIFFPIHPFEESVSYWASTPSDSRYHDTAESLSIIISTSVKMVHISTAADRWTPCPIRPVTK